MPGVDFEFYEAVISSCGVTWKLIAGLVCNANNLNVEWNFDAILLLKIMIDISILDESGSGGG